MNENMKPSIRSYLVPRLRDIFFIAIFIAVLMLGPRMLNMDGDLPRHLRMGQLILDTGSVPVTEPFVYPYLGKPYVTHEWLSTVIFAIIYNFSGLSGIVILSALLISGTFLIIFAVTIRHFNSFIPILFITAWGAAVTSLNWVTRPHLFSMLFLAIWLVIADRLERGKKISIWWFPALMVLWSNLHGEFIAGILIIFALAVGWTIDYLIFTSTKDVNLGKKIWAVLLLSFFASLLNPSGIGAWRTMFSFVNNPYLMSRMSEANSPNFHQSEFLILLGLIVFSIFILAIQKGRISTGKALILAGFTAMSLQASRNIHLYGVVVPFVLAETMSEMANIRFLIRFEDVIRNVEQQLKGFLWPIITVSVISLLLLISGIGQKIYLFSPEFFPVDAITWLGAHPQPGNMFNDLNWGGYIELYLWPEKLAFIDSMTDVTGDLTKQYETALLLEEGWADVFEQYNIEWVIMPSTYPLSFWLEQSQEWEQLYKDEMASVWRQK